MIPHSFAGAGRALTGRLSPGQWSQSRPPEHGAMSPEVGITQEFLRPATASTLVAYEVCRIMTFVALLTLSLMTFVVL